MTTHANRLESIYKNQLESYQKRKNDYEEIKAEAVKTSLPKTQSRETKLKLAKWLSFAAIALVIYFKFF